MVKKTIRSIFAVFLTAIIFSVAYLFVTEWAKTEANVEKIKKYEHTIENNIKNLY